MQQEPNSTPDVAFPAPLLYGAALVLVLIAQARRPLPRLPGIFTPLRRLAGGALVAGGLATGLWGVRAMQQAGTSPDPRQPTEALVVDGPFKHTRNPLYLTMTATFLGISLLRNNLWGILLLAPLVRIMERGVIEREEGYLQQRFGDDYRAYAERVPRWL